MLKLLADDCLDPETLRYRNDGLAELVDSVCTRHLVSLSELERVQVAVDVAAALPPNVPRYPDAWETVASWIEGRKKRDPDYSGALNDLLVQAWRRLIARAEAEHAALAVADPLEAARAELGVAGRLLLLAYDGRSGEQMLSEAALGLALTAGLIAELVVAGLAVVEVRGQSVTVRAYTDAELAKAAALAQLTGLLDGDDELEKNLGELLVKAVDELGWPYRGAEAVTRPAQRVLVGVPAAGGAELGALLKRFMDQASPWLREHLVDAQVAVFKEPGRRFGRRKCFPLLPILRDAVYAAVARPAGFGERPAATDAVVLELVRACGLNVAQAAEWPMLGALEPGAGLAGLEYDGQLAVLVKVVRDEITAALSSPPF